jgi:hypothetical protein
MWVDKWRFEQKIEKFERATEMWGKEFRLMIKMA